MECRLYRSSGEWSCQVYIRWEFNEDHSRLGTVREDRFGPLLTCEGDVEITLRRAQAAVLNPTRSQSDYLYMDIATLQANNDKHQLKFSNNAVCIDLQGPDFTELTFTDLPGECSINPTS